MGTGEASRHELRLVTTGLREILTKYFAQQMHTNKFIEYIESYFVLREICIPHYSVAG